MFCSQFPSIQSQHLREADLPVRLSSCTIIPLGSFMLPQILRLFLRLDDIWVCLYPCMHVYACVFLIQFLLCILSVVNNAAVCLGAQMFLWDTDSISYIHIYIYMWNIYIWNIYIENGVAAPPGCSIWGSKGTFLTVFHVCTNLYPINTLHGFLVL